jgi:precorrin-2 dehydrogenase
MIPLMIDLSDRTVVIFGGGNVGARKAAYFCREARVLVVSRSFSAAVKSLPVELVTHDLDTIGERELKDLLSTAFIAVAATQDHAINDRIGRCCRRLGVLFDSVEGEQGDITVPSVVRGDRYLLAISTEGRSPTVARFLREQIQTGWPLLDGMIGLQERLRFELKEKVPSAERRREISRAVIHDHAVWDALKSGADMAWDLVEVRYLT